MKRHFFSLLVLLVFALVLIVPLTTNAALKLPNIPGLSQEGDLKNTISAVSNTVAGAAASLDVLAILYGGIQYIIARGDDKRTEEAKNTIKYAVMGMVIIVIAWTIVAGSINLICQGNNCA